MRKYSYGDIFSFKIANEKYISGKILLDVKNQCVIPKLIKPENPLWIFNGAILVEIYKEISSDMAYTPSEVLIPGIFVDKDALKEGLWHIIDNKKVNPTIIEFPEFLISSSTGLFFGKGEIRLPLPNDNLHLKQIDVFPTLKSSFALSDICLYYLGLKHLIGHEYAEKMNLADSDLRFSPYRSEIYNYLGEDEKQSYYEMSLKFGYDIVRFYK